MPDEIDLSQSSDFIPTVYASGGEEFSTETDLPVNDGIGDYFAPGAGTGTLAPYDSGNMFSGSDLAKLFAGSPLLQTLGAAGLGKLADKIFNVQGGPGGYKGGIPTLTAYRQQLPIPTTMQNATGETVARRPGSGGVTYFSPMQYLAPGQTPTPPAATGIASIPASTPPAETVAEPTGLAMGGIANLGSYSDGGRLLKGPGDGVSDSIPATIGGGQPARLADGEFVIPARIVSELGNGSTEAGARKLYAMMDRIKKARGKAKNIAADTKSDKHLPA
jgi:hypothetical protein